MDEMESQHSYAMLKQGLEDEIAVAKKQLSQSTQQRSTTEEELHTAEAALTETEATLAADTKYLAELKQSCETKATEWAARQKQAGEESAAIEKAKEILSEGVKVFLQTSTRVKSLADEEASADTRAQAVRVLSGLSKKFHSFALVELASRARSDPFGKVRSHRGHDREAHEGGRGGGGPEVLLRRGDRRVQGEAGGSLGQARQDDVAHRQGRGRQGEAPGGV